jgi:hypothetical protein
VVAKTQRCRLFVQVEDPGLEGFDFHTDELPPHEKQPKIAVQVGTSWPVELDASTDKPTLDSKIKVMIVASITGVAILQLMAFTTYGWLFSEEVLKDLLSFGKCLTIGVMLWAIGPQMKNKLAEIVKALGKADE